MANIKKRSETSYQITISAGYNAKGQKLRKYKTINLPEGMTERQREKELTRQAVLFEEEVENGQYMDGKNITFAAFAQKWMEDYAEKNLAPATLPGYRMRLERRILPALGHLKLAKIQPHHLMEFYNQLNEDGARISDHCTPTESLTSALEDMSVPDLVKLSGLTFKTCQRLKNGCTTTYKTAGIISECLGLDQEKLFTSKTDKKLSDKTVRHHHGLISTILGTAVQWNLIPSNPAERVSLGKMTKYRPAYYDDEQVSIMLEVLEAEPLTYKTMIYLTIDTGMRTGEITGLKWSDIDFDKMKLSISRQRQYVAGYGILVREPKTESGIRTITLSSTIMALLRQYKTEQIQDMLSLGIAWNNDCYVFLQEDGTPLHPDRPYKWFTAFLERHGLPKITYHQLRHTNASLLIAAGLDVVTLSGRLGHGDKNITLGTYSHIIKSKEEQAANRMDIFYNQVPGQRKNFEQ